MGLIDVFNIPDRFVRIYLDECGSTTFDEPRTPYRNFINNFLEDQERMHKAYGYQFILGRIWREAADFRLDIAGLYGVEGWPGVARVDLWRYRNRNNIIGKEDGTDRGLIVIGEELDYRLICPSMQSFAMNPPTGLITSRSHAMEKSKMVQPSFP